MQLKGAHTAL